MMNDSRTQVIIYDREKQPKKVKFMVESSEPTETRSR